MMIADDCVTLRAAEPSDLDFLYRMENAAEGPCASLASAPASRHQLAAYLENYSADIFADKQLRLVIEVTTAAGRQRAGVADISDFNARDRHGFVGICLAEDCRGRGYGRAALSLLCDYAEQVLGMHSLCAVVGAANEPSRRLFLACGFKGCGRLRSWIRQGRAYADAILFQRVFA